MHIVFSDHPIPQSITRSIFLAGPSPRELGVVDWRHEAISYLNSVNYDGTLFIPVPEKRFYGGSDSTKWSYNDQVDWECKCRHVADIILFWVPRSIEGKMPAFVTNIEFGEDLNSGKIVYGRPTTAEKCKYLDKRMIDLGLPVFDTLEGTFNHAISLLGDGSLRTDGEVYIPLFIWNSPQFKSWYSNLQLAGNKLIEAQLKSHIMIKNKFLLSFTLWANVWVESEQRYKDNEFIFSRTDISTIVAYYGEKENVQIVIIKEFRTPVNNKVGMVFELPGGSAAKNGVDPKENAQHEFQEESGILIENLDRFEFVSTRQLVSTMSTHQAHLYKVKLNEFEYNQILGYSASNNKFGVEEDGEKTYVSIVSLEELKTSLLDYSMLGMIYEAIYLK